MGTPVPSSSFSDDYFKSYEDFGVHRLMLEDVPRTDSYRQAILSTSQCFKDKTVMDVGAGTGILSLFAAEAGAAKVYAVEASNLALLIKEIAKENNFEHVIEVMHCKVEDLKDDIQVDIIISEWMGFFLIHESMIDSVIHAREKHLKSGGLMYPESATLSCAPCSAPDLFNYWDNVYGFKMTSVKECVRQSLTTKPEVTILQQRDVLVAEPRTILSLDLRSVSVHDVTDFTSRVFASTDKAGSYQGVALWFDVTFPAPRQGAGVVLSTAPAAPPTHWKQTLVVWPEQQQLEEGDVIAFEIQLVRCGSSGREYNIHLRELDPSTDEHPVPCECGTARCNIIRAFLEKSRESDSDCELPSDSEEAAEAAATQQAQDQPE